MKIQIASDLHLEWYVRQFPEGCPLVPAPGAELLILAGDIHSGDAAIAAFKDWPVPVCYVSGNHEAYGYSRTAVNAELARRTAGTPVHFLECTQKRFPGIRVLGCTLWTDYELNGNAPLSKLRAGTGLADHHVIQGSAGLFTPQEAAAAHKASRRWLERELATPFEGKTVVVTHHGPHPGGISPQYAGSVLNPSFFSDLRPLLPLVDYWIHGHTHDSVHVQEGRCTVLANPRGYPKNLGQARTVGDIIFENKSFDPALVIEL